MAGKSFAFARQIFLAATPIFLFLACENDMKEVAALGGKRISVDTIRKVESYYSQQAKMKARLTAPIMLHYQADTPYYDFPRSMHVDFYNDTLLIESKIDARYAKYKENDRQVYLRDSVVISNLKGDTLHCQELWWDQQKQIFHTDKPVRIHRADGTILYGIGLEADQNFSWFNTTKANGPILVPSNLGSDLP